MEPRITRDALFVLGEDTLIVDRQGRIKDQYYSRAKLTASTLRRLSRITVQGKPQLTEFGPKSRPYVGLIISVEANWSPAYALYRESAVDAHAQKILTFEEYRLALRCMDRVKGSPMHAYYADLLFLEDPING